jgi:hypothetical protein
VAGLQLPRRQRRRLRRHLVRGSDASHAARPRVPRPRCAAVLPRLRRELPDLARAR